MKKIKKNKKSKPVEMPSIDLGTSRMLSERSTCELHPRLEISAVA